MEYGKSFRQWCKEVERAITKQGYSTKYADAIRHCVSGYYTGRHAYMEPLQAANVGLYPQPMRKAAH